MNAFGIGIDAAEVERFVALLSEPHALKKIYTPQELLYCLPRKNAAQHLAGRFAAKEAVYKALAGCSGARTLSHLEIEIVRERSGAPTVRIHRSKLREQNVLVSISHTKELGVAIALNLGRVKQ